jgi:hypothetical protein
MKSLYLKSVFIVFLSGLFSLAHAQRFFSVVFDKLPKDNQLYARDDKNEAAIPISGYIEVEGFTHMAAVVYKDNQRISYARSNLKYEANTSTFSLPVIIKAELAEYSIEVYACKAADSLMMVKRTKILAGDFYMINGQSNAAAVTSYRVPTEEYVIQFSRTLGRIPDDNPGFTPADTLWKTPDWVTPVEGYWGRDLQRQIIETYKIPVCILNGAVPGTNIQQHLDRNSGNPANTGSIYGHLLYRVQKSQATKIRAFFWYQGEEDAWNDPGSYPGRFDQLMKFWQQDYPMVDKFVVVQINIMDRPHYAAGALREFQRQTKYKYPKTDHFSVIGLGPLLDNVHYTEEGYMKFAKQLRDYLGPKVYQTQETKNIDSPDLQTVFYSKAKDAITMVFDTEQTMKWQTDTTTDGTRIELKNQFYLDGDESKPAPISSWVVSGNRITMQLAQPSAATRINYLPSFKNGYYHGPFLQNTKGLGAFSFHEITINPALADNNLTSKVSTENIVELSWLKSEDAVSYILEKKSEGQSTFMPLKTLDKNTLSFNDPDVEFNASYTYRLKTVGALSESPFSEIIVKTLIILGTEPAADMVWTTFPNPTRDFVEIQFKDAVSGNVQLTAANGSNLISREVHASTYVRIDLTTSPAGLYFLTFKKKNGDITTRKIVKF